MNDRDTQLAAIPIDFVVKQGLQEHTEEKRPYSTLIRTWAKLLVQIIRDIDVQYNVLERAECPDAKQRGNLLAQWKRRGWVELNEELNVYVKTQNYYQKHAA